MSLTCCARSCSSPTRTTSRYHPHSNEVTERLVRTIKGGITRFETENDRRTWDEWLLYLVMDYRMSN
jgi:hypothetical protein